MKIIRNWIAEREGRARRAAAARRLAKTLKPRPEIRARRLAQMHGERKTRCLRNMASIHAEMRGDA